MNVTRENHVIVNTFFEQVSIFDGLQWIFDHFGSFYMRNYMWFRLKENGSEDAVF